MNTNTTSLLLVAGLTLSSVAACDHGPAAATTAPETGYVTGRAVDTLGNPIPGARIYLDNTLFSGSYIDTTSREDGGYRVRVYPGAWRAYASFRKDYNGRTYTLRLRPDAVDSFDQDGAVRNFTWQLEGRRPENDAGFYGGYIHTSSEFDFESDMEDVELVFTPDGPLIDGSPGTQLRLRLHDHYWRNLFQIDDIPIGRYTVTATLQSGATTRPLRVRNWHGQNDPVSALQLDFLPEHGSTPGASAAIVIGN
ncbi:MAG: carboxypeptidase-like regulatory domain-containing protein [Luteimonas sp.]